MENQNTNNQVELRSVNTLLGKRYYIPSYQRGYRWTSKQIIQLLDDLKEFYKNSKKLGDFYCLQPIVVVSLYGDKRPEYWRDSNKPVYEVIDGQQRLTSILLLLMYLKNRCLPLGELYELKYETREESSDFIANIQTKTELDSDINSDYWHIYQAYSTINKWFEGENKEWFWPIYQLLISGDEQNNVRIIWYGLDHTENKIDVFSRLNIGKIPLTDAELIKALFLRRGNFADSLASLQQIQLASEWDMIEHKMQIPSFWAFIYGRDGDNVYHNRIELIFSIIAEAPIYSKQNRHHSFEYYYKKINEKDSRIDEIWLSVKQLFLRMEEWYDDYELYHYIGYLISSGDKNVSDIVKLSSGKSKSDFVYTLKDEIKKGLNVSELDDIQYSNNKLHLIRKILLLFNIETILSSSKNYTRFPFERYLSGQWDVEHIRSQTEYSNKRYQESLLKESIEYFESFAELNDDQIILLKDLKKLFLRMSEKQRGDAYQGDFDNLFDRIQKHFHEDQDLDNINGLGNLTLLDSSTNSSYGNSPFVLKRQRIVKNDSVGVFTPITTKNVFLKYYSRHSRDILVWRNEDAQDYLEFIKDTLKYYINKE